MSEVKPVPKLADPVKKDSINTETYEWYFKQCAEHRELLNSVRVVVPVRPQDGMACQLSRMLSIWYGEGTPWSMLNDHMGGFIEHSRANIAWTFKNDPDPTAKYLLMIDNDMEVPVNLPYLLGRHDQPIVGGCAISVDEEYGPQLCFSVEDDEGDFRFPTLSSRQKIPAAGLKRVGHAGTGVMMIRRDVIEAFSFDDDDIPFIIPEKLRIPGAKTGRLTIGEDIAFCNQVRAKGFPLYVDLEAHCGHRKTVSLQWDSAFTDPSLKAETWRVPCYGKVIQSR